MTKGEIFVAIFMKTLGIEEKNGRWLGGPCAEVPDIGRKHPGPAERFARSQCICRNRTVLENRSFDRNGTVFDQIKAGRWLAGAENHLATLELLDRCTSGQEIEMMWFHLR